MFKFVGVVVVVGAIGLGLAYMAGYVNLGGSVSLTSNGKRMAQESSTAARGVAADALDKLEGKIRK